MAWNDRCNPSLSLHIVLKCIGEYFRSLGRVGEHLVRCLFLQLADLYDACIATQITNPTFVWDPIRCQKWNLRKILVHIGLSNLWYRHHGRRSFFDHIDVMMVLLVQQFCDLCFVDHKVWSCMAYQKRTENKEWRARAHRTQSPELFKNPRRW